MSWQTLRAYFSAYDASEEERLDLAFSRKIATEGRFLSYDFVKDGLRRTESRAGVFLTHVSVMIAITGVLWATTSENWLGRGILSVEIIGYLCVAISCLRCQISFESFSLNRLSTPKESPRADHVEFGRQLTVIEESELIFREKILFRSTIAVYLLTISLIITVALATPISLLGDRIWENRQSNVEAEK